MIRTEGVSSGSELRSSSRSASSFLDREAARPVEETQRTKGCAIRTEATRSMCTPLTARLPLRVGMRVHGKERANKQDHVLAVASLPPPPLQQSSRPEKEGARHLAAPSSPPLPADIAVGICFARDAMRLGIRKRTQHCCWPAREAPPRTVCRSAAATSSR